MDAILKCALFRSSTLRAFKLERSAIDGSPFFSCLPPCHLFIAVAPIRASSARRKPAQPPVIAAVLEKLEIDTTVTSTSAFTKG